MREEVRGLLAPVLVGGPRRKAVSLGADRARRGRQAAQGKSSAFIRLAVSTHSLSEPPPDSLTSVF